MTREEIQKMKDKYGDIIATFHGIPIFNGDIEDDIFGINEEIKKHEYPFFPSFVPNSDFGSRLDRLMKQVTEKDSKDSKDTKDTREVKIIKDSKVNKNINKNENKGEIKMDTNSRRITAPSSSKFDFNDVNTDNVSYDIRTQELMEGIISFEDYKTQRNNMESMLNPVELNEKINYILQYFFEDFKKKLNKNIQNKAIEAIIIRLEIPKYNEAESNTYKVVMNQVAHKKAVKIICDILKKKGYTIQSVTCNQESNYNGFVAGGEKVVQEYYIISIAIS